MLIHTDILVFTQYLRRQNLDVLKSLEERVVWKKEWKFENADIIFELCSTFVVTQCYVLLNLSFAIAKSQSD